MKVILIKSIVVITFLIAPIFIYQHLTDNNKTTIYFGGPIITMNEKEKTSVEAIFIRDGKVFAVGSYDQIIKLKDEDTELIDLKGKTLMPGLIAIHTHPDVVASLYDFVDLSGFSNRTPSEVWSRLDSAVRVTPKGKWIFCKGFDPMLIQGLVTPSIKQLDEIAPNNPLVIIAQSLHSAWANSSAFKEAGITNKTSDPAIGSYYEKDKTGKLTGFIAEGEAIKPFSKIALKTFNIKENIVRTMDDYMSHGFTTITTMGLFAQDSKSLTLFEYLSTNKPKLLHQILDWLGILPNKKPTVRHFIYIKYDTPFLLPNNPENGDDFFRVQGLKIWYDGSPYTGSMYMKEPYINSELMRNGLNIPHQHSGMPVIYKDDFIRLTKEYHKAGWQLSVHSQGDKSGEEVINLMEETITMNNKNNSRHRIEHCLLLPSTQFTKMKELNLSPSFHINHIYYYGKALENDIIGKERLEKALLIKSAINAGLKVSLHADAPMYPEDAFSLIQTAVTRKTKEGNIINANEGISVLEGLQAMTINSAWQLMQENKIGSIEPGKYADLIILDKNPLEVQPDELRSIKIISTIINGKEGWRLN